MPKRRRRRGPRTLPPWFGDGVVVQIHSSCWAFRDDFTNMLRTCGRELPPWKRPSIRRSSDRPVLRHARQVNALHRQRAAAAGTSAHRLSSSSSALRFHLAQCGAPHVHPLASCWHHLPCDCAARLFPYSDYTSCVIAVVSSCCMPAPTPGNSACTPPLAACVAACDGRWAQVTRRGAASHSPAAGQVASWGRPSTCKAPAPPRTQTLQCGCHTSCAVITVHRYL